MGNASHDRVIDPHALLFPGCKRFDVLDKRFDALEALEVRVYIDPAELLEDFVAHHIGFELPDVAFGNTLRSPFDQPLVLELQVR